MTKQRDSIEAAERLERLADSETDAVDAAMLRLAAADMRERLEQLREEIGRGANVRRGSAMLAARVASHV